MSLLTHGCDAQAVHNTWAEPEAWRPERFLPGGEYSSFPEGIRPFMARTRLMTRGSAGNCVHVPMKACHPKIMTQGHSVSVRQHYASLHLTTWLAQPVETSWVRS